jgi:hypothetical protein
MHSVVYILQLEAVAELRGMSVLICAAGDIHGALERLYADVLAFEAALSAQSELRQRPLRLDGAVRRFVDPRTHARVI